MHHFYSHGRRWLTEVRKDQIDLKIDLTSKDLDCSNDLPEELYMTHTYKLGLNLVNFLKQKGIDASSPTTTDLIFSVEVLDSDTLTQAVCSDPTKKMLSGLSRIRVTAPDLESPIFLKIKFMESKKIKLPSSTGGGGGSPPPTSPPLMSTCFYSLMKACSTGGCPLTGFLLGGGGNVPTTTSTSEGGCVRTAPPCSVAANLDSLMSASYSSSSSSNREQLADPLLLKQQIEALNAQSFDFFRLRIIVYEVGHRNIGIEGSARSRSDLESVRNHLTPFPTPSSEEWISGLDEERDDTIVIKKKQDLQEDLSELLASGRCAPIISKISAPFKVFSKKQHAKKKKLESSKKVATGSGTSENSKRVSVKKSSMIPSTNRNMLMKRP